MASGDGSIHVMANYDSREAGKNLVVTISEFDGQLEIFCLEACPMQGTNLLVPMTRKRKPRKGISHKFRTSGVM